MWQGSSNHSILRALRSRRQGHTLHRPTPKPVNGRSLRVERHERVTPFSSLPAEPAHVGSAGELQYRKGPMRATATQRGYDAKWQRTRRRYLRHHPVCECDECSKLPYRERPQATVVHHLDGNGPLGPRGHDPTNLQAMSKPCHDRTTAREQPGGWNVKGSRRREAERHPGAV